MQVLSLITYSNAAVAGPRKGAGASDPAWQGVGLPEGYPTRTASTWPCRTQQSWGSHGSHTGGGGFFRALTQSWSSPENSRLGANLSLWQMGP